MPPPPPTMALDLITLISHKPWVAYYQTLSSINIHVSIWKIYQNLPLTFDLHLDGLHRYMTLSLFIKIPTKLYHNWTLLPGVITPMYYGIDTCTCIRMHTVRYVHTCTLYSQFSETLTNTLTKSLKGYKITIPEWNAEHGDSNERRHSTWSFETGFKTIHCTLLELEP